MRRSLLLSLAFVLAVAAPAAAQEAPPATAVTLTTPYAGVAVKPGDSVSFTLNLDAPAGERVALAVDAPDGWTAELQGGGFVVDEVMVSADRSPALRLELDVPPDAVPGAHEVVVRASAPSGTAVMTVTVTVDEAAGGGVSLSTDFPVLQGPSDVTFTFDLQLENDTPEEVQFGLEADAPLGWQVELRPAGQSRASTVTLGPGESKRISVDVDPPTNAVAGSYPIVVRAVGGGETAEATLETRITGNYAMVLDTADQRLNAEVAVGGSTEVPVVIVNTGTADLLDVSLSATAPRGWEATFDPESVDLIRPGETAEVTMRLSPADDAIAGDYRVTVRARTPETDDQIELRVTVTTSGLLGLAGLVVIAIAVGGLLWIFRRYGRR